MTSKKWFIISILLMIPYLIISIITGDWNYRFQNNTLELMWVLEPLAFLASVLKFVSTLGDKPNDI